MNNNKTISIKEIAKICNVSVATVSRVINNNGRFSEETKKKVLATIEEYNYHVNMAAKTLRTNKSNSIGILVPNINNEFFSTVVLEIEKFFFPKGYSIFICNTSNDEEREKEYLKQLDAKGVDGLIYIGMIAMPLEYIKRKIPIVCIDRKIIDDNIVTVESDNRLGGFLATEELINKGCKNILILESHKVATSIKQRFYGYLDAFQKHNYKIQEELIVDVNVTVEGAQDAIRGLIKNKVKFDGIFATNDRLALGALIELKENKIKVPEEVKIVGFDNTSLSKYSYPALTTINQNKYGLAQEAGKALLNLIEGKSKGNNHVIMPVELIKRDTT